jgi:L-threonylcarbamoyladenylate synthase
MRALLERTGLPLAAPSANASGTISPTNADHVRRSLDGRIPLVIDDGATNGGIESTIVAVMDGHVRLLRPGPVQIENAAANLSPGIEAPGQLAAHYAPVKPLRIDAITATSDEWHIGFGEVAGDVSLSPTGDLVEAAARLFALLHQADAGPATRIAVAPVPRIGIGIAINDRLRRAAVGSGTHA